VRSTTAADDETSVRREAWLLRGFPFTQTRE
jgi:hypothetical protein